MMGKTVISVSLMLVGMALGTASDTPSEQYAALLKEYRSSSGALREAETDGERKAAAERLGEFSARFVALAENHPSDPITLQVLRDAIQALGSADSAALIAWESNSTDFPEGISQDLPARIVTVLRSDYLKSDQLSPVCDRMRYAYRPEFGQFLEEVFIQNPHHEVKGLACLSLAQFQHDRLRMLELVEDRPELVQRYHALFGSGYLETLRESGHAAQTLRIESLLRKAIRDYNDIEIRPGVTVGSQANGVLTELLTLSVGKLAPETKGLDQDGVRFKLSDYRGKVVLLYFWSEY